mgnify:FL=1|jgi:hypothetical protein
MALHYNVDFSRNNRLSNLRKKVRKVADKMSVKVEIYGKIYMDKNVNELHVFIPKRVDEFIRALQYPPTKVHWDSKRLGATVPFVGTVGAHIIYAL